MRGEKNQYVDVFLGSGAVNLPEPKGVARTWKFIKGLAGNAHPGAVLPFGRLSACAYSGGYSAGYGDLRVNCGEPLRALYGEDAIFGFTHLQQSGTGFINTFYNYALTVPFYGALGNAFLRRRPEREAAEPGYYAVGMRETGVFCELTAGENAVAHRYTFPRPGGRIAIDFSNDGLYRDAAEPRVRGLPGGAKLETDEDSVRAEVVLKGLKLYFYAHCPQAKRVALWRGGAEIGDACQELGETDERFGAVFDFGEPGAREMRLSISPVSMARAKADALSERATFDELRAAAAKKWADALGRIDVLTDEARDTRIFYSNLYQSLIKPSDWSGHNFIAPEEHACALDLATMWDQYKTQLPLLFACYPEISEVFARSVIAFGRAVGHLPHQLLLDGHYADAEKMQARLLCAMSLTDAYDLGIPFDYAAALREIARDAFENPFNADFLSGEKLPYAAQEIDLAEGLGCAARMARELGEQALAEQFEAHKARWRDAYDAQTGLVRADSEFYEGSNWNYSFRLHADMPARIALAGGREAFCALLDRFFGFTHPEDQTARFEGFNNETDMETPYAYHFAGRRDRLTEVLTRGMTDMYTEGRGGLPGNNDSGGLSSLYVWNALGIFPVSGQNKFIIGAPIVRRAVMKLSGGGEFAILKRGNGRAVEKAVLNGKTLEELEFSARELRSGGTLELFTDESR